MIAFWSVDQAGNTETPQSQTINIDATPPVVTASANRSTLLPANGKTVSVTVTGKVTDALSGVDPASGSYSTADSYGKVQPAGSFTIAADGNYSFSIQLEARRNGQDKEGRRYTITVKAKDGAGNTGETTVVVTVPHNQ